MRGREADRSRVTNSLPQSGPAIADIVLTEAAAAAQDAPRNH